MSLLRLVNNKTSQHQNLLANINLSLKNILKPALMKNVGKSQIVAKTTTFYFEFGLEIHELHLHNSVFTSDEGCLDQI